MNGDKKRKVLDELEITTLTQVVFPENSTDREKETLLKYAKKELEGELTSDGDNNILNKRELFLLVVDDDNKYHIESLLNSDFKSECEEIFNTYEEAKEALDSLKEYDMFENSMEFTFDDIKEKPQYKNIGNWLSDIAQTGMRWDMDFDDLVQEFVYELNMLPQYCNDDDYTDEAITSFLSDLEDQDTGKRLDCFQLEAGVNFLTDYREKKLDDIYKYEMGGQIKLYIDMPFSDAKYNEIIEMINDLRSLNSELMGLDLRLDYLRKRENGLDLIGKKENGVYKTEAYNVRTWKRKLYNEMFKKLHFISTDQHGDRLSGEELEDIVLYDRQKNHIELMFLDLNKMLTRIEELGRVDLDNGHSLHILNRNSENKPFVVCYDYNDEEKKWDWGTHYDTFLDATKAFNKKYENYQEINVDNIRDIANNISVDVLDLELSM